ncbi:MAG: hypothetical protein IKZ02_01955 [Alphaproteobacteria bacterium]|nr:hypothetical protein [Alphaproteobacteria bacterium]
MSSLKKWILIMSGISSLLLLISWGIHSFIGSLVVEQAPRQIQRFSSHYAHIKYTDLKSQNCFFSTCLSADNVSIQLKTIPPVSLYLGRVQIEKSLGGNYKIQTQTDASKHPENIHLNLQIETDLNNWTVQQADFNQINSSFKGQLTGRVNIQDKKIELTGQGAGLSDFFKQFIPPNFRFISNMFLKNQLQNISVKTDDDWIKILNIPVVSKKLIFK